MSDSIALQRAQFIRTLLGLEKHEAMHLLRMETVEELEALLMVCYPNTGIDATIKEVIATKEGVR